MVEKIEAILFDLDDTLVNSKKAQEVAICKFKRLYDKLAQISDEEIIDRWNRFLTKYYGQYFKKEIPFNKLKVYAMKELFASCLMNIPEEQVTERLNEYTRIYEKSWMLFDDTIKVLEELKGKYKMAIISNGDGNQQRRKIEQLGIAKYFTEIIISGEVGTVKPDKEIFNIACEKLNENPENCIMIGDKYSTDIEGSINAGMKGILINRKNENIDYENQVENLSDILKLIE